MSEEAVKEAVELNDSQKKILEYHIDSLKALDELEDAGITIVTSDELEQ